MPSGQPGDRPSSSLLPQVTSMITTGSVLGKCVALQLAHSRCQPHIAIRLDAPHFAQN